MKYLSKVLITGLLVLCSISQAVAEDKDWQSPMEVAGSTRIDVPEAVRLHAEGVPFIDVRSERYFIKRHIAGAHHLGLKTTLTEESLAKVAGGKDNKWVVIYCNGAHCSLSYRAITKAVEWGFKKIYYFRDGFRAWRLAGHPIETGK